VSFLTFLCGSIVSDINPPPLPSLIFMSQYPALQYVMKNYGKFMTLFIAGSILAARQELDRPGEGALSLSP